MARLLNYIYIYICFKVGGGGGGVVMFVYVLHPKTLVYTIQHSFFCDKRFIHDILIF